MMYRIEYTKTTVCQITHYYSLDLEQAFSDLDRMVRRMSGDQARAQVTRVLRKDEDGAWVRLDVEAQADSPTPPPDTN